MKAVVVTEPGAEPVVAEVDIDTPRGREVLIEVKACGLCRSDITFAEHGIGATFPAIFGHEVAGVVMELGPDVTTVGIGDHVIATLIRSCRECDDCRAGKPYECSRRETLSRSADQPPRVTLPDGTPVATAMGTAGFAELAVIHENQLVRIPDSIPLHVAAIAGCSTLTGAGTVVNTPEILESESIAIFGAGGVGLNAVNAAAIAGIPTIIAIDTNPEALELARAMGATDALSPEGTDIALHVRNASDGGVSTAVEFVGAPDVVVSALRSTRAGGRLYLGGIPSPHTELSLRLLPDLIMPRRSIVPVYMGFSDPQRDLPRYMEQFVQGRLLLDRLVTQTIPLDRVPELLQDSRLGGPGRVVMVNP